MANLIASDDSNPEFVGARNPNTFLNATFYVKTLQNNFESEKQGKPVFYDETWIRILIPGRNDLAIDCPARQDHFNDYPMQYARFKNSQSEEAQTSGTPLSEWPAITRSQAEELRASKFYTVEQIANCSDGQSQALGMNANMLRTKAKAYLENAQNSALAQHQAAELERKKKEIDDLKSGMNELAEQVRQLLAAKSQPKRGRPRKVKDGPDAAATG